MDKILTIIFLLISITVFSQQADQGIVIKDRMNTKHYVEPSEKVKIYTDKNIYKGKIDSIKGDIIFLDSIRLNITEVSIIKYRKNLKRKTTFFIFTITALGILVSFLYFFIGLGMLISFVKPFIVLLSALIFAFGFVNLLLSVPILILSLIIIFFSFFYWQNIFFLNIFHIHSIMTINSFCRYF